MTIIYSQLGEPLASEVMRALIELAAVARKASWAASEHLESVANDLLTCVLTLCKAERGAILLREDHPRFGPFEPASAAPGEAQTFRLLACIRCVWMKPMLCWRLRPHGVRLSKR